MMVKLGKKKYTVIRNASGEWVDGEWVDGGEKEVYILANIQYASMSNKMRHLQEGDWSKEAISIRSQQRLYTAETRVDNLSKADIVLFDGKKWECRGTHQTYGNGVLNHTEMVAIKLDED